jgi:hypothetical protein
VAGNFKCFISTIRAKARMTPKLLALTPGKSGLMNTGNPS